jgi:GH25 family lysozyme M1 (1,4-beta-N-acetylmuramidase)
MVTLTTAAAMAALAAAAMRTPIALAADSWSISIGIRETGSAGAIGENGGTTGGIEWINLDAFTLNADDTWHTATWNFAPGLHTATNFSGGNGILSAANNKGVLEHIRIKNTGGNSGGEIRLRIDDIVNTVNGVATPITGFEGFSTSTANDTLMFREPIFSGTTRANMSTGANGTLISTASANSGAQSLAARWTFVPNGDPDQWLRLTTNNASTLGNPIVDIGPTSSLSIAFRMSVYNPTGTRVRGIDASQFQGTGHDWVRAAAPMSAGGGGMSFAFLRATRGGTSGTSTTGSMRVIDPEYAANIAGAKAAGLLTGPYHFGRPDRWTPNDTVGLGNAPNSVGTPEDEARHYLNVAGNVMKPGYMRPVYDLEDGNEELNNAQLTNFVLRFNDTLKKYKGPAAQIIVYAGTSYANSVNEPLSQFPLWMPRFQVESDWSAGDIFPNESNYGVWGDNDPLTNLRPWNFWQYYSPDVYIPGINAGTHNDIDVANGDINYVRQFMVQGAIWDGSAGNAWTNAANWSTNAAPTASTEVLFDLGTPATIVVAAGQQASGVYFADNYTLAGGGLSLSDGRIDVDATKSATVATSLLAPNGFRKVGLGMLTHGAGGGAGAGASNVTGTAQVLQGTLRVTGGSVAVSGTLMVNPELTQFDRSLVEPFPTSTTEISSSTLTIQGGSVTANAAYVGGTDTAAGAIGTLNVSLGSLAVTGPLKIWNSAVPMVDSKVNLTGGTLSVGSLDTDGDPASFNWTAGIFAVTGAGGFAVATGGPIGPSLTVGSAKQLIVFNALTVGVGSTLTLQSSGAVTVGSLDLGGDQSRFNWGGGGTLTINGPGSTDLGTRTIGTGGGPQFLNINGGSVTNASLNVGALSAGTVNHAGGTHTIAGALNVGIGLAVPGTHNVSGSAVLNANGGVNVGGGAGAPGGAGVLNISGGTTTTPTLKIWDTGAAVPGGTRVNLSGGTLSVGSIDTTDNPARFNFTGGTLNHHGPGTSDIGGTTVAPTGALHVFGGAVGGASLAISTGGLVQVHPAGTLAAQATTDRKRVG